MTLLNWRDHPATRAELRNAAHWYGDQDDRLGEHLIDEAAAALRFIREWPGAASLYRRMRRTPQIRRKALEAFPYAIIYFVRDNEALVVAYAQSKRRPAYWRSRLREL